MTRVAKGKDCFSSQSIKKEKKELFSSFKKCKRIPYPINSTTAPAATAPPFNKTHVSYRCQNLPVLTSTSLLSLLIDLVILRRLDHPSRWSHSAKGPYKRFGVISSLLILMVQRPRRHACVFNIFSACKILSTLILFIYA